MLHEMIGVLMEEYVPIPVSVKYKNNPTKNLK